VAGVTLRLEDNKGWYALEQNKRAYEKTAE